MRAVALTRLGWWIGVLAFYLVVPFVLAVQGAVLAERVVFGAGWLPLLLGGITSVLLLVGSGRLLVRRLGRGGGRPLRWMGGVALAFLAYGAVFLASGAAAVREVGAGYREVHPILRVASGAVVLLNPGSVEFDPSRGPEDHWLFGLSHAEAGLHEAGEGGWVRAVDFRARGFPVARNLGVELVFRVLGLHTERIRGLADHLHVSLP